MKSVLKKLCFIYMTLVCFCISTYANAYDSVVFIKVKNKAYPSSAKNTFNVVGHGVVVSQDGYILTTSSLLGEAEEVDIVFFDNKLFKAKVVARDLQTDLAIVKIDGKSFRPINWGLAVAKPDSIFVLGSPHGLAFSVTRSVISEVNRSSRDLLKVRNYFGNVSEEFSAQLLQYDLSVSYGHGAVVADENANVFGITTEIYAKHGYYGLQFAIPAFVAQKVANDLIKLKRVVRSDIGVQLQTIDETLFLASKLDTAGIKMDGKFFGVVVVGYEKDSSVQKSGSGIQLLKLQDIIVKINGTLIYDEAMVKELFASLPVGSKVMLDVWRNGAMHKIELCTQESSKKREGIRPNESTCLNVRFVDLKEKPGKPHKELGLVVDVVFDSLIAKVLRADDIILEVNGANVQTVKQFDDIVSNAIKKSDKYIILLVSRKGKTFSCALELALIKRKQLV